MSATDLSSTIDSVIRPDTTSRTRIHDPRLLTAARMLWISLVVLSLSVIALGIVARFNDLRMLSSQGQPEGVPMRIQDHVVPLSAEEAGLLGQLGLSTDFYATYFTAFEALIAVSGAITGIVIFWRRSDDWMALFVSFTLVGLGIVSSNLLVRLAITTPDARLLADCVFSVSLGLGFIMWYIFPDGRFVPGWTRWPFLVFAIWALLTPFFPRINIILLPPAMQFPVVLVAFTTILYAQVYRYRHISGPLQRQQTKWVIIGSSISFLGDSILHFSGIVVPAFHVVGIPALAYRLVGIPIFFVFTFLPILSIGFSIVRYRLWNVDLVINRSLVYGTLTVVLGIVFLGGLALLQALLGALLGGQQTAIAAIIATAIVVGLFNPARHRLQGFVDRRFYHLNVGLDQLQQAKAFPESVGTLASTQLGPYQVLAPLGHGGMGEVYKGHDTTQNRAVAIKILPDRLAQESQFRARFEREARTVAGLNHPNIVSVFDFGEADGKYYMVMEFVAGLELGDYLKQFGSLSIAQALPLVREITSALDYAHGQGLVHRDVKPANIMLQPLTERSGTGPDSMPQQPFRTILMDFGIAKIVGGDTGLTGTGMMGTLDYVAPEQIVSARQVDRRADVYSLGVMVYQLLTGQLPFPTNNSAQLVFAHLQQPPPDPCILVPDLPTAAARAIGKAMAKQPEDRFQSAGEFALALAGL